MRGSGCPQNVKTFWQGEGVGHVDCCPNDRHFWEERLGRKGGSRFPSLDDPFAASLGGSDNIRDQLKLRKGREENNVLWVYGYRGQAISPSYWSLMGRKDTR